MDDGWKSSRDALSTPLEHRPTGLKTMMMEETLSALRVLQESSRIALDAEHEEAERVHSAMCRLLAIVHRQIRALSQEVGVSDQVENEEKSSVNSDILTEATKVFSYWRGEHLKKALPMKFWLLWVELGCSVEALKVSGAGGNTTQKIVCLVTTSPSPESFPTSRTHCNKETQTLFCCALWDAVLRKPLYGTTKAVVDNVAGRLMGVFLHWMAAAMRGYEVAYIANVAAPFRAHIASLEEKNGSFILGALVTFANAEMDMSIIAKKPAAVAITVLTLSALTPTHREPSVEKYFESLRTALVDELANGSYPQAHTPSCIAAVAFGLVGLEDANTLGVQRTGAAALLHQFALLRLVNLPLHSPRLNPCDDTKLKEYQAHVRQDLQALLQGPSSMVLRELSIRMIEACVEEMVGFYHSSLKATLSLVTAAQSVLPDELFRPNLLKKLNGQREGSAESNSPSETVAFVKRFYGTVAPILEVLSTEYVIGAFLALSRLEFAREICASPAMNASMQSVTERLEQTIEQLPETVFSAIFRSLAMQSTVANVDIPSEVDIIAGCQALALGLVVQRKLRVLLFQCASLVDDALAVVFSGLFNVFEPVDAFAHRFLGVCLSHLGQFTPLFSIFPHYIKLTLAAFPANASRPALTKACGAIFGSLFYSEALTTPELYAKRDVETSRQMVLWAVQKCCERSSELLVEEANTTTKNKSIDTKVTPSETDGIHLAGLVFELMKMAPINLLKAFAMEVESLLARWKTNTGVLRDLKSTLFDRISQNCEAEKRAWMAAWYIEVDKQYPTDASVAQARL